MANAVWSDPRPVLAVAKAIEERAYVCGRWSSVGWRKDGNTIDTATRVTRNPYWTGLAVSSTFLRETPSMLVAQALRTAIIDLLYGFVDMEFDYATRDWYEFPRSLRDLWNERGTGHDMGIEPGANDGEVSCGTDSALARWRDRNGLDGEKAAKAFIRVFNRKLFENPVDNDLTWTYWFFPVINTADSLRTIDRYAQDCVRFLVSGKRTKARFNVRYEDMKALGLRSLVHTYYDYSDEERARRSKHLN